MDESNVNIEALARELRTNNIGFVEFANKNDCISYIKGLIKKEMKIGWGGSMTLNEIGLLDYLRQEKYPHILDRDDPALSSTDKTAIQQQAFSCDVFFCSANAITEDGLIVNIDGYGNRVAPTIYGPREVYFIVGINKLVKNYKAALARIKTHAAPLNAKRLGRNTPCATALTCMNCNSVERICNYTTIINRDPRIDRTHVLLIHEDLGL